MRQVNDSMPDGGGSEWASVLKHGVGHGAPGPTAYSKQRGKRSSRLKPANASPLDSFDRNRARESNFPTPVCRRFGQYRDTISLRAPARDSGLPLQSRRKKSTTASTRCDVQRYDSKHSRRGSRGPRVVRAVGWARFFHSVRTTATPKCLHRILPDE
jgi:hypothetical protein